MGKARRHIVNERELVALKMLAEGRSYNEISETLEMTLAAYHRMMARLRVRCGVQTTAQLMFRFGRLVEQRQGNFVVED